jgi:hypothetical protein
LANTILIWADVQGAVPQQRWLAIGSPEAKKMSFQLTHRFAICRPMAGFAATLTCGYGC